MPIAESTWVCILECLEINLALNGCWTLTHDKTDNTKPPTSVV